MDTWGVVLPDDPAFERVAEAIGTLSNGWAAIRASREEGGPGAAPLFAVNGVYTMNAVPRLLAGPLWITVEMPAVGPDRRVLDMRTGILVRTAGGEAGLQTIRFISAARPHAMALRVESEAPIPPGEMLAAPVEDDATFERQDRGNVVLARTTDPSGGGILVAAHDSRRVVGGRHVLERLAAWAANWSRVPDWSEASGLLGDLERIGFDRLLAEHREEWARRWADAEVNIAGSAEDELAARFAVFHLLGAAPDEDAAVGARALTGHAYGGHVFWDADVYVLPALAAIRPTAARAMLEYRIRRLAPARSAATERGFRGARFPWESAADGTDVTPAHARNLVGELMPILTGEQEEHIVADVAWAACDYAAWTGDDTFLTGAGRDLLLETARYWASRVEPTADGRAHISRVIGPDEYHEAVDDNAYTNVMARWNLREAAALVDRTDDDSGDAALREEAAHWRDLAGRLVDGWDPERGLYEQFAGYWDLEPLLISEIADPPVAADVLLGRERVSRSQLIKQPDVLMLYLLVPDEVTDGSLAEHIAFYTPRTAHGSSLSPAVHAALFARAGQPDRALEFFRLAARLDLDDVTGTTAGGLHLATMGGVWQALARGFLGLRPRGATLHIDPCLPVAWDALTLRLRFRGRSISVRADHGTVAIRCTEPLWVSIAGGPAERCQPPGRSFPLELNQE